MKHDALYWIDNLGLLKHPEGGYFREVYRSEEKIDGAALPERFRTARSISTSIYFLLDGVNFSAFHRLKSDETWHFYAGDSLTLFCITEEGELLEVVLGNDPEKGERLQYTIMEDTWFAARTNQPNSYSLIGCTVAPGFDFEDFELGMRDDLIATFPLYKQIINELTRA